MNKKIKVVLLIIGVLIGLRVLGTIMKTAPNLFALIFLVGAALSIFGVIKGGISFLHIPNRKVSLLSLAACTVMLFVSIGMMANSGNFTSEGSRGNDQSTLKSMVSPKSGIPLDRDNIIDIMTQPGSGYSFAKGEKVSGKENYIGIKEGYGTIQLIGSKNNLKSVNFMFNLPEDEEIRRENLSVVTYLVLTIFHDWDEHSSWIEYVFENLEEERVVSTERDGLKISFYDVLDIITFSISVVE